MTSETSRVAVERSIRSPSIGLPLDEIRYPTVYEHLPCEHTATGSYVFLNVGKDSRMWFARFSHSLNASADDLRSTLNYLFRRRSETIALYELFPFALRASQSDATWISVWCATSFRGWQPPSAHLSTNLVTTVEHIVWPALGRSLRAVSTHGFPKIHKRKRLNMTRFRQLLLNDIRGLACKNDLQNSFHGCAPGHSSES